MTWTPTVSGIAECGNVEWILEMNDGSAIDLAFNNDFSLPTKTMTIASSVPAKAGFYVFKVTVYYDVQPTVNDSTSFQIELRECLASSLDVDASIWLDYHYYIYETLKALSWSPAATGIADCGTVEWQLTMLDSSPIDTAVFTENFSLSTKTMNIYSTDVSKASIYVFEVRVLYDI